MTYYVRGYLPQANGNIIPKWAHKHDGQLFTSESPDEQFGFDTKIEAEEFLVEVMRDCTMQWTVRGWQVVDELGNFVCHRFNLQLYWFEAERRERREQALDREFHHRWVAPAF